MKKVKKIKQKIKSYEDFCELLEKKSLTYLETIEPSYCEKFHKLENKGMDITKIGGSCNKLLTGKLNRLVELLESLSEVGYYWKRLTEVVLLLEISVPETPIYQMKNSSWFVYNCDFFWHSAYGLEERLLGFLKKFKRLYKSPSIQETWYLDGWLKSINMVKNKSTKLVRDPLTHTHSRGTDIWHDAHFWEAYLIRKDSIDFIDLYETTHFLARDYFLKFIRQWVLDEYKTLSFIFNELCTFSLDRLELNV